MSVLIFRLNDAPADEAEEVRSLLRAHGIGFHETGGGLFGFAVAGLWVADADQAAKARALIDAYERDRAGRVAAEYAARRAAGEGETILGRLVHHPWRSLFYLTGVVALLYLTLMPFLSLGR